MADIYFEDATHKTSLDGDEAIGATSDPSGSPADVYVTPDDIAGYVLDTYGGYAFQFGSVSFDPADGTSYYVGEQYTAAPGTSGAGGRRIYIPRTGTIIRAYITFVNAGTLGTNETSTAAIRVNNTSDTTISASVTNDSAVTAFNNTSLSVNVNAGDYIEIKWTTPTWATNPTTVYIHGSVLIA